MSATILNLPDEPVTHIMSYLSGIEYYAFLKAFPEFENVYNKKFGFFKPLKDFLKIVLSEFDTILIANSFATYYLGLCNKYNNINVYVSDDTQNQYLFYKKWENFKQMINFPENITNYYDNDITYYGKIDRSSYGLYLSKDQFYHDWRGWAVGPYIINIEQEISNNVETIKFKFRNKIILVSLIQIKSFDEVFNRTKSMLTKRMFGLSPHDQIITTRAQIILEMFFAYTDKFGLLLIKRDTNNHYFEFLGKRFMYDNVDSRNTYMAYKQKEKYEEISTADQLEKMENTRFYRCLNFSNVRYYWVSFHVDIAYYELYLKKKTSKLMYKFVKNFYFNTIDSV